MFSTLQYGNGTLRLTTRQTYQLHGVLKQDLKTVFSSVIKNMGSTLAACGDVNRNVMSSPAPYKNRPDYDFATQYANDIADLLAPQSGAYYDVWLDGEKFFSHEMEVKFSSPATVLVCMPVKYSLFMWSDRSVLVSLKHRMYAKLLRSSRSLQRQCFVFCFDSTQKLIGTLA